MQILTKNGTDRTLACTVGVLDGVFDFAGKPVELITAIDITDYKLEVYQAFRKATQLNELRQHFVSMLCHQFRTPLNVISFSTDLLKRHIHHWSEQKNISYLDLIQSAVKQISELLDEVLLFGKAEAAKLEYQPKLLDLNQFCREILVQIQLTDTQQKLITFVSQGNCTSVWLEPKLLRSQLYVYLR